MHILSRLFLFFVLALSPVLAWAEDDDDAKAAKISELGIYVSDGATCAGKASIIPSYIAWTTPDSICAASDYAIIESSNEARNLRSVFAIHNPSFRCKYSVWVLTHTAGNPDPLLGWNLQGFANLAAYSRKDTSKSLSCPIAKMPDMSGK